MKANSLALMFGSAILLSGCFHEDEPQLRVTHASSDAPLVAITLNGKVVEGLEEVDYQVASGFLNLESGTYDVGVKALLPGGESVEVIGANLDFAPDMQYDIIALNNAASIEPVVLSRETIAPGADEVRIDVLHGTQMCRGSISTWQPMTVLIAWSLRLVGLNLK